MTPETVMFLIGVGLAFFIACLVSTVYLTREREPEDNGLPFTDNEIQEIEDEGERMINEVMAEHGYYPVEEGDEEP